MPAKKGGGTISGVRRGFGTVAAVPLAWWGFRLGPIRRNSWAEGMSGVGAVRGGGTDRVDRGVTVSVSARDVWTAVGSGWGGTGVVGGW